MGNTHYKLGQKDYSVISDVAHLIYFCSRIYERVVEAPYMDIPEDASFWLGQRNAAHGFFKVSVVL